MNRSKLCSVVLSLFVLYVLVGVSEVSALAQDDEGQPPSDASAAQLSPQEAGNLRLSRTWIRTQNDALSLTTTLVAAFASTSVTCPATATAGCTIRVTASSQFQSITAGSAAVMNVSISGAGAAVDPASAVIVDSTTTGRLPSVRTFQWIKRSIPAGSAETVAIQFQVAGGSALAGFRTGTIDLYLN